MEGKVGIKNKRTILLGLDNMLQQLRSLKNQLLDLGLVLEVEMKDKETVFLDLATIQLKDIQQRTQHLEDFLFQEDLTQRQQKEEIHRAQEHIKVHW